jgi:hypothetical protein
VKIGQVLEVSWPAHLIIEKMWEVCRSAGLKETGQILEVFINGL